MWEGLTRHFQIIASDLIGLGRSDKPKRTLTVGLQADVIEGILKAKGITEAHILAHDLGDTVAQELLARQTEGSSPMKWLSCTLMNGGIFPETHHPLLIQKLLISPIGFLVANLVSKKSLTRSFNDIFSKEHPPSQEFLDETWRLMAENDGRLMIPRLIQYMAERREKRERWVSPLENNIVPLKLIDGAQDPISGAHMAERYREVVPNADITLIEDAGHYPHVETPEKVLDSFLAFIRNHQ